MPRMEAQHPQQLANLKETLPPSPSQLPRMEAQHQQQLAKLKADVTRWKDVAKVAEEAGAAREAEVCVWGGKGRRENTLLPNLCVLPPPYPVAGFFVRLHLQLSVRHPLPPPRPVQLVSLRECIASLQAGAACSADSDAASSRQRVLQLEAALKAKEKEAEKLRSMRDATAAGSSGEVGRKGVGIYLDPDACAAAGGGAQSEGEGDGERS